MAFVHGKNFHISIDNASGTLTDLSSFCDSVDGLPGDIDMAEVTASGDGGRKYIPGLENASFTVSGHYDDTATTGVDAILNGLRGLADTSTFEYGPAGDASGKPKYSGECRLTSYTISSSVSDRVTFTASFNVDGTVTYGSFT